MPQSGSDLPNGRLTNGLLPHSILKDSMARGNAESRKIRHLSNESSSSVRGVTFDKSLPCSALRSEEQNDTIREMGRSLRNRRTSLPVSSHAFAQRSVLNQPQGVPEARGIVMDMLQNRELALDSNVVACLRAVASLLNAQQSTGPMHGGFNFNELGLPKVIENPYSGEQLIISSASKPRVSNITFSTVTSATGLPTIAAEPSRPRSSNYWKPTTSGGGPQHHSQLSQDHGLDSTTTHPACTCQAKTASACVLHPSTAASTDTSKSPSGGTQQQQRRRFSSPSSSASADRSAAAVASAPGHQHHHHHHRDQQKRHISEPTIRGLASISLSGATTTEQGSFRRAGDGPDSETGSTQSCLIVGEDNPSDLLAVSAGPPLSFSSSNYLPAGVSPTSHHSSFSKSPSPSILKSPAIKEERESSSSSSSDEEQEKRREKSEVRHQERDERASCSSTSSATEQETSTPPLSAVRSVETADRTLFNCDEIERDQTLKRINEWSFPIFHFADRHRHTVLSRLTYAIFKQANLFNIFKLSPVKFFNFFHALESRYWEIPYHNRIHAADVLHGCHYLICHPVRAFLGRPSTPDDEDEIDEEEGIGPLSFGPLLDSAPLPIAGSMSALELMALYTAAAAHDVDHPGRTNAFLVAAEDRKAILYNDRSVLENHHAAESWRILSHPQNNFIETLDSAETKRFRYLVLEFILATDLKQHFDIIMSFNDKAPEMDLTSESDRVLVSQMLIKFADINSPAKPFALHRQWTERICQEFYEQGDEEKRKSMPISPYMNRNEPAVAKLQDSFIAHIVNPLVMALNEAGLLPVLPGLEEPELLINLKHNHQKWLMEIEEQQQALDAATENEDDEKDSTSEHQATANPTTQTTTTTTLDVEQLKHQHREREESPNKPTLNGTLTNKGYTSEAMDENVGRLE